MSNVNVRGMKRICQSEACGLPFYDLNRVDISCPNCGTVLDTSVVKYARTPPSSTPAWKRGGRSFQRAAPTPVAEPAELADVEVDGDGEESGDADASELILEVDTDDEVVDVVAPPADERNDV
jgi:uncharacterized protein (TIGR02300 family)